MNWPLPEEVRSFYPVGDSLLVRVNGKGLCRFEDGRFELLPGGTLSEILSVPMETGAGLAAVTGLAVAVTGGVAHVFLTDVQVL